jgi:acyl carrier protein
MNEPSTFAQHGHEEGDVERAVIDVLADLTGLNAGLISLDTQLVEDLRVTSDDLTFVFVPTLEKRLKVKAPVHEWRHVATGRDAVNLLKKHLTKTSE